MPNPAMMVAAVLARPGMYTLGGTFGEVVAFLEGYFAGAASCRPQHADVRVWSDFARFVGETLIRNASGRDAMESLHERYGTDSIRELRRLYDDFTADKEHLRLGGPWPTRA